VKSTELTTAAGRTPITRVIRAKTKPRNSTSLKGAPTFAHCYPSQEHREALAGCEHDPTEQGAAKRLGGSRTRGGRTSGDPQPRQHHGQGHWREQQHQEMRSATAPGQTATAHATACTALSLLLAYRTAATGPHARSDNSHALRSEGASAAPVSRVWAALHSTARASEETTLAWIGHQVREGTRGVACQRNHGFWSIDRTASWS